VPTPITTYPAYAGLIARTSHAGAPAVLPVDDISSSSPAEQSGARNAAQTKWEAVSQPSAAEQQPSPQDSVRLENATTAAHASFAQGSGPFLAQRLAQESETETPPSSRASTALAAYLRTRDSHIQLLPAYDALDLRV
jgi:hypothetical protein